MKFYNRTKGKAIMTAFVKLCYQIIRHIPAISLKNTSGSK